MLFVTAKFLSLFYRQISALPCSVEWAPHPLSRSEHNRGPCGEVVLTVAHWQYSLWLFMIIPGMSKKMVQKHIREAFSLWSSETDLTFAERSLSLGKLK
jgi:hypothetical protein